MDKNIEDVDKHVEWLYSEPHSASSDIFGVPQKTARIGDKYQAQIPSLMTENEHLQHVNLPVHKFEFGLPIPVTWVQNQHKNKEETMKIRETDNDLVLVPGTSCEESWTAIEHDSFLLGLYIFDKNLQAVNKFMGNKGMPNLINYYYGTFYRSSQHQKWSIDRKKKNRKSVIGKKMFNGWRRHELLSRLLPNVTDERKTILTQVIRMFDEGKLSFEKYVFSLRDTVGIDGLVEAAAIGKGKQDLTVRAKKRLRSKKKIQSALKTQEIVDLLKDRIGLSKARLNELFWEAVWPRLLAKGWHSEQLKNSNRSLVFLAAGVTKFSRRSLEKGSQYFDSLTEVLSKVASEPQLLEHEHEHENDRLVDPQAKKSHDEKQDLIKCKIVDTSLVGVVKVKELTVFEPADMQLSSTTVCEHDTTENEDCEMDLSANEQPVRKLKFVFKPRGESQRATNDKMSVEDSSIVIDLNKPRVGPVLEGDDSLTAKALSTNEQPELSSVGVNVEIRQSRRNRPLTAKALEALADGFLKRRAKGSKDGSHRRVRAKTALVSSCGELYRVS